MVGFFFKEFSLLKSLKQVGAFLQLIVHSRCKDCGIPTPHQMEIDLRLLKSLDASISQITE